MRVAILYPGDMGAAVGQALKAGGCEVLTCLEGRSPATQARAAGFENADLQTLARQADLILSILPPSQAVTLAERVADAMRAAGRAPAYADCNAIAPATLHRVAAIVTSAGATVIDGGIVGSPPGRGAPPRFYVSGPELGAIQALDGMGIQVRALGAELGRASAMKMCYAGLTKGTNTLHTAVLMAAQRAGLFEDLIAELGESQAAALKQMTGAVPFLPADSARWIGEMEEIAVCFSELGVTPAFHEGAAEIFRHLAQTPFAKETRATMDRSRSLAQAVEVYAHPSSKEKVG